MPWSSSAPPRRRSLHIHQLSQGDHSLRGCRANSAIAAPQWDRPEGRTCASSWCYPSAQPAGCGAQSSRPPVRAHPVANEGRLRRHDRQHRPNWSAALHPHEIFRWYWNCESVPCPSAFVLHCYNVLHSVVHKMESRSSDTMCVIIFCCAT